MSSSKILSHRTRFICALLFVATLTVYLPVARHDFIKLDDNQYVTFNPRVQAGITWGGIAWALRDISGNWHPVTWLSHMLDCELYGLRPAGHHLTNALLHAVNAVLLLLFLSRSTGTFWASAFVAAVFALHPLRVESVAWVAERKDVLSASFGLLTLLAYSRYVEALQAEQVEPGTGRRRRNFYPLALGLYALGLMSKPMLVTWPFLMLLLDIWPFRRISLKRELIGPEGAISSSDLPQQTVPPACTLRRVVPRLIIEKLPFAVMAAALSVLTLIAQRAGGALLTHAQVPLAMRIPNACASLFRYFEKTFWPSKLAPIYPWVQLGWLSPVVTGGIALVVLASSVAVLFWKSRPWLATGWFWFVGLLVPVIGLVQVGIQSWADRYSYLPQIGLIISLTWIIREKVERFNIPRAIPAAVAVLALVQCVILTSFQLRYWQNTKALFEHTMSVTRSNVMACNLVAGELLQEGKLREAEMLCRQALDYSRAFSISYSMLGDIFVRQEKFDQALACYQQSLERDPTGVAGFYGMAVAHFAMKDYAKAEADARAGLQRDSEDVQLLLVLAKALQQQRKLADATLAYRSILNINPHVIPARRGLAIVLAAQGEAAEAIDNYLLALRANADEPELHAGLGLMLLKQGRALEAEQHLREAYRLQPTNMVAVSQLAAICQARHDMAGAVDFYRLTLKLQPDLLAALNNLGWILASDSDPKLRDGPEAVRLAERACTLTDYKNPTFLGTLAAAYAEAGQFDQAVNWAEKSRELALSSGNQLIAERSARLAEQFRARRPFHQGE